MPHTLIPTATSRTSETREAHGAPGSRWNSVRAVLDAIPDPAWITTRNGRLRLANRAAAECYGYQEEEWRNLNIASLIGCEQGDFSAVARILSEEGYYYFEAEHRCRDGRTFPGEARLTLAIVQRATVCIVIAHDNTLLHDAESAFRKSQERFKKVFEYAATGMNILLPEGYFLQSNQAFCDFVGYSSEELRGMTVADLTHPDDLDKTARIMNEIRDGKHRHIDIEKRFLNKQGDVVWGAVSATWICNAQGRPDYGIALVQDITDYKKSREALEHERWFLQTVVDGVVDPLIVVDLDYRILMMNRAAGKAGQGTPRDGELCYRYFHRQEAPCCDDYHPCPLAEVKRTGNPVTVVHYQTAGDGSQRIFEVQASPYRNRDGDLCGIIESSRDITYLFEAEEQLREKETRLNYLVQHDTLTSLPNRDHFYTRLRKTMLTAGKTGNRAAVLLLDLDRFKNINESLGHDLGDRVLCRVADRLRRCLRDSDLVARSGGDEFVIILEEIQDVAHIDIVARKIHKALSPLLEIDSYQLCVTGSLGISVYPEDGADAEDLMRAADTALFRAKEKGRNTYQFYTPDMNARSCELLLLESSLRRGIEQQELVLHYQPQIDLFTGHVRGMEALVRWNHPQRGMIPPGDFIPLAEETGLIVPMGEWVLREACRQNRRWQALGFSPIRITVNISARQFLKGDLVQMVAEVLEETTLDPCFLELEITESMVMDDVETAIFIMAQLAALGVHLAIDDFGTGYSSLAHLKRFPLTTLKIDRAFVKDLTVNGEDEAIVRAIVALAHSLDLQVIAEGIETEEQYLFLKERGCEQGQGFLFSKPLPADKIRTFLRPLMVC
ncbi:hypothetical protein C2E25_14355 [Geothermobacter hydrogeniphilus]|uniref:PAS domain S-box-containing protein/diguanylate cyclase (GGDEF) domain-containing protein n=1 Tax=Geothermobacter hydrogeniphilus TaxID=1969733 RepID=A0A2K2H727_9BACT|nr:EAL domain-containing protein [Geothermobacter hydrogeniphilus]PNU19057.1 hypothetical protein C2E25_14355 [Geothermobacter hydrogeniphilus]